MISFSVRAFRSVLESEDTEKLFKRERSLARYLDASRFPSLRLKIEDEVYPITVNYSDYQVSLTEILTLSGNN